MVYFYSLVAFLLVAAASSAAYLPVPSVVPSRHYRAHHATHDVSRTYRSLAHREHREARPPLRCNQRWAPILASSANEGDAGTTGDVAVAGVTLKMAFDASPAWGVADLSETKSERFTSPESLDMVHRLRRESSAVLVGRGTVERDDCSLTVRRVQLGDGKSQPTRVVLDPSLSLIGGDYTLLKDRLPTIIYYLQGEGMERKSEAASSGSVTLVGLEPSDAADVGRLIISPSDVIKDLADRGLHHIMVEGGPATARAFLEAGAVDRAILVRAPIEFEMPVPAQMDFDTLKSAGLKLIGTADMGGDTVEYWTRDELPWPKSELDMWP